MGVNRRRHTAEYKLRILKEVDICKGQPGAVGALLRKEGLYFSVLSQWRKQRDQGALSAMSEKRGRKPKLSKINLEMQALISEKARLEERLRQAELIIELQKKVSAILGLPIDPKGMNS
jgi:transposase-like protein